MCVNVVNVVLITVLGIVVAWKPKVWQATTCFEKLRAVVGHQKQPKV